MMRKLYVVLLAIALATSAIARAQPAPPSDEPAAKGEKTHPEKSEKPQPEQSVSEHTIRIGGQPISYTATIGTIVLRDDKDEPIALVGYTAYVRKGMDVTRRPITFAYNGGPGSSSIWLHMGALGPRRIQTSDAAFTPPAPYRLVDNDQSILDVTDIVMIDPVGTGYSHAVGKKQDKEFWGVDPDIESVSQLIFQYVSDNGRWNSPKFLFGESYGTTRSAGVVDFLQQRHGMAINGVVLVSCALDIESIFNWPGNDRPYPLFLPTYAATAWFHKKLPQQPPTLEPFLTEVRQWALGPYAAALAKGDLLSDAERDAVAAKLHQYTGLSEEYIKKADLRVAEGQFTHELLADQRETVGRLDSRFTGFTFDPLAEEAEYDPQSEAVTAAFTAAFHDYVDRELHFGRGKTYHVSGRFFGQWDFKHKPPGSNFPVPIVNTGLDLAHALGTNPGLRVLVLDGYYDLATPFLAAESMFSHLGLSRELLGHITTKYYDAGHMMYLHPASLERMKQDVAAFITTNQSHEP